MDKSENEKYEKKYNKMKRTTVKDQVMNDEVDRPEDAKVAKTLYNQPTFSNRKSFPPQNSTHVYGEFNQHLVAQKTDVAMEVMSTDQMDYAEDHFEIEYDEGNNFIQIDDSSVTPENHTNVSQQIFNTEEEEKGDSITDVEGPDKVSDVGQEDEKSTRDSTRTEFDGPGKAPVTKDEDKCSTEDRMSQKSHETDGIQSMHRVYFPQPSKSKGYKFSINSESYYDMKTFPRGRMVLINVKNFKGSSGMADCPRDGTDRDADMLCQLFLDLGFQVDRYDNPTCAEIKAALKETANADYTRLSCSACAILTHGGEKGIIYGTDATLEINELTCLFQTKGLAGKPKLFFFQACRGLNYMESHDTVDGSGQDAIAPVTKRCPLQLPIEADFLFAYSTVEDYYSWRNSSKGSWFVNALVSVFRESAHKLDIMRMLSRVNDKICMRESNTKIIGSTETKKQMRESNTKIIGSTDKKKQIGSIVTQLRKELFFFPPNGPLKS